MTYRVSGRVHTLDSNRTHTITVEAADQSDARRRWRAAARALPDVIGWEFWPDAVETAHAAE